MNIVILNYQVHPQASCYGTTPKYNKSINKNITYFCQIFLKYSLFRIVFGSLILVIQIQKAPFDFHLEEDVVDKETISRSTL